MADLVSDARKCRFTCANCQTDEAHERVAERLISGVSDQDLRQKLLALPAAASLEEAKTLAKSH